jgi:hypothetical protein
VLGRFIFPALGKIYGSLIILAIFGQYDCRSVFHALKSATQISERSVRELVKRKDLFCHPPQIRQVSVGIIAAMICLCSVDTASFSALWQWLRLDI